MHGCYIVFNIHTYMLDLYQMACRGCFTTSAACLLTEYVSLAITAISASFLIPLKSLQLAFCLSNSDVCGKYFYIEISTTLMVKTGQRF